ncbi:PREDICTED: retinol dehydrogenase 12-like [Branchiostoma belcheri]|uniref:Retinol dehydrogenase 12-like n=1 Tax=Branchiostoma belcheri TaxID=7741 RepID=A0A6P4YSK3_BRABE|nr:PREDICTED: retinol dehydrogenase 12-like [Branchiostoma belcheri]
MVLDTLRHTGLAIWQAIAIATAVLVSVVIYLIHLWISKGLQFPKAGVCRCDVRMDGKTVIVTGSNTGTGKEAARDLAQRGARVILACRNARKAEKAAEEIRKSSGNGNVEVGVLDLASLSSVRDFCTHIIQTEPRLDVLVNNAGFSPVLRMRSDISFCPRTDPETADGFELMFAVNHLGHFLLTNLLLDLLKKSAPSRVVTVSSGAHVREPEIDFNDINFHHNFSPIRAYRRSKLASMLFVRELARRLAGSGVTAVSLTPGYVATSRLNSQTLSARALLWGAVGVMHRWLYGKTLLQGAQTTIHCSVADGLRSGQYFSECKPKDPAPQAMDDEAARKLWELSEKMVALSK